MKQNSSLLRTDFRLEQALCRPDKHRACYKVMIPAEEDLSPLLPYLNAAARVIYYDPEEPVLTFQLQGYRVVVRPHEVGASLVGDLDEGRKVRDLVASFLEDIWARRHEITPKHEPRQRPPAIEIYKRLPQTNCGLCGEPTCLAFAVKLSVAEVELERCSPLKEPTHAEKYQALKALLQE